MTKPGAEDGGDRVVLATPAGRGAVASIIVQGRGATAKVSGLFAPAAGKRLDEFPMGQIVFGRFAGLRGTAEELVVCCRGQDLVEIHCHGGPMASEAIIERLVEQGCREVSWRDWPGRVESDSIAAAARVDLASALTARAAAVLLDQYHGALRSALERAMAHLEAGQAEQATQCLRKLLRYAGVGMHLVEPWQVVLTGRANVGKSSLINAILGYQRAIVFDQPGTTRDVVTAYTALAGWPVRLADTPGIRSRPDAIESAGVALAREQIAAADLVVLVFDAAEEWSEEDEALMRELSPAIVVHNKCDLPCADRGRPTGLLTSATTGAGVEQLIDQIAGRLIPEVPPAGAAVPFRPPQVEAIRHAIALVGAGGSPRRPLAKLRELVVPG